jgi:2,4-dienoyl-CoA reductase-like NADH-dependent reductase (Old Yellow Enzyme family)
MNKLGFPFRINDVYQLKNRLVVAPMTTSQSFSDGKVSEEEMKWLERLAFDGYGMVITCAASISLSSVAFENQMSLADDSMLPGLTELAGRMKKHDTVSIVQLCHAGSRAIKSQPYSASSYHMPDIPGFVSPYELNQEQIQKIISDFIEACVRAAKAGFDGIELHGANGYLFTQFMSKMTNLRQDKYGGSLENRMRFSREVVRSCRKAVPDGFIIGFRVSFENMGLETGLDIDENIALVNALYEDGIDYIHISSGSIRSLSIKYPETNLLEYVRKGIPAGLPLIGVGGVMSPTAGLEALSLGADLVAIGRAAIGNRNVPELFVNGKNLPHVNPFPEFHLDNLGIGTNFKNYLRKFPVSTLNVIA